MESLPVTEGQIEFKIADDVPPCFTYYKVVGELHNGKTLLIALHGGPGVNHEYLLVLSDLTKMLQIPLVVYDQIGTGRSTHYPNKMGDVAFWTEELFVRELDNLINNLGISDGYILCGHSWGGMLAARHAVRQPKGLKKLILMSAPADMKLWVTAQDRLRSLLPKEVQEVLTKHEKEGTTDSAEYQEAVGVFYARYLCIMDPMPAEVTAGFAEIEKDPTVYLTMNGPSEFHITGLLANWSIVDEVRCPCQRS
ncbi:proline-specific peptidase [Moniliophthora roreri MCA 2997]|uniref:Proline-specific peptidase n=1 Tax=Moniliophthora roreri (strain MCA 2997) TaxID=1381753 RepID=V2XK76_MONRO|nr:proline-specific peptidase [Moniliophthora roreri MCA 2997]